jgi:ribosomal protein S18 acetylase RimI-like enzyme
MAGVGARDGEGASEAAVRVRRAAAGDGDSVRGLLREVADFHLAAIARLFGLGVAASSSDDAALFAGRTFAQILEAPDAVLLVAEADGDVIGALLALFERPPASPPDEARRHLHVLSLAVRADWRRLGAGRALMRAAHARACEAGATDVALHVWEFNDAARAFYESLGYATIERRMRLSLDD